MENNKQDLGNKPFFRAMSSIGDCVALSVLWLVCSLPIVTLGASTSAAFSVAGKMAAKEDHFVWKGFFSAFRRDFAIATRAWLPMALIAAVIVGDYQIGLANPGQLGGFLIAAAAAMGLVWLCAFGGCFSLLGRFSYSKAAHALKDGLVLCTANPKATAVWLAVVLVMPALYLFVPPLYYYLRLPWLFVGGGAAIVAFSYAIRPAFIKLEKK